MQATSSFPEITITPSERRLYKSIASTILRKAVVEHTRWKDYIPSSRWRQVRSHKGMSAFRSTRTQDEENDTNTDIDIATSGDTISMRSSTIIGSGQIVGTLEQVMDGLYCDSTADLRCVSALLNRKLVDCAVLNVTARRTLSNPFRFEGIKWRATKAPWRISTNQDLLTYERTGMIVDKQRTEVAYHMIQSIDRAEWPADVTKGFKREHASVCYLYRRDSHGLVRCFFWGQVANLSPVTQRAAEYVVAGLLLSVMRSVECARAKQCSALIAACTDHSVESAGIMCRVCYKRAGLLGNRLVVCAGCSRTTCKTCSSQQQIFQLDSKTGEPEQRRLCKFCLGRVYALKGVQIPLALPSSTTALTTSMPTHQGRSNSAPPSFGIATHVTPSLPSSPPSRHKVSHVIRYDLLEPPSSPIDAFTRPYRARSSSSCCEVTTSKPHINRRKQIAGLQTSESTDSFAGVDTDAGRVHRASVDMHLTEQLRQTEALDAFDLGLDLDLVATTTTVDVSNSSGSNDSDNNSISSTKFDRTYHELVFTWRDGIGNDDSGDGSDKESFLDDLYVGMRLHDASSKDGCTVNDGKLVS